jgi:peroxiredoxin
MLQPGDVAPDFELPGATIDRIDTHSLSEYTDRGWAVVLTFYPFDFHPACVSQWCALRDAEWLTLLDDVVVLGIGTDSAYSHVEFALEYDLQFALLSDNDGSVGEAYDVLTPAFEGHRRVPERAIFVVGPHDREIRYAWAATDPADEPDMAAIRAATTDEVTAGEGPSA